MYGERGVLIAADEDFAIHSQRHKAGAQVIPVLLRPIANTEKASQRDLFQLQVLPRDLRPITDWGRDRTQRDLVWAQVLDDIAEVIKRLTQV